MERNGKSARYLACIVLYRNTANRVQFCLVRQVETKYWEFPSFSLLAENGNKTALEREIKLQTGLVARTDPGGLLDQFDFCLNGQPYAVRAILMHVSSANRQPLDLLDQSYRWCEVEEARAWLRRKAFRRLIDMSVRRLHDRERGVGN